MKKVHPLTKPKKEDYPKANKEGPFITYIINLTNPNPDKESTLKCRTKIMFITTNT